MIGLWADINTRAVFKTRAACFTNEILLHYCSVPPSFFLKPLQGIPTNQPGFQWIVTKILSTNSLTSFI